MSPATSKRVEYIQVRLTPSCNSCNKHVLGLGTRIKESLTKAGITGYQFGTVGVSDGISMGTFGMSYSLQSRDLIADQVETAAAGHWLDGMVTIPVRILSLPLMCQQVYQLTARVPTGL